jgi:hypothetical protein
MPKKVVKIEQVFENGYTYIGNGEQEAILPANPQEAQDILDGFMGAKQEMTQEEYKAWRNDVLEHGPLDRYLNFCIPRLFMAVHANTGMKLDQDGAE